MRQLYSVCVVSHKGLFAPDDCTKCTPRDNCTLSELMLPIQIRTLNIVKFLSLYGHIEIKSNVKIGLADRSRLGYISH